jgi:hypothetical protein
MRYLRYVPPPPAAPPPPPPPISPGLARLPSLPSSFFLTSLVRRYQPPLSLPPSLLLPLSFSLSQSRSKSSWRKRERRSGHCTGSRFFSRPCRAGHCIGHANKVVEPFRLTRLSEKLNALAGFSNLARLVFLLFKECVFSGYVSIFWVL